MASPTDRPRRELADAARNVEPMRVAQAFRDAADSIASWSPKALAELTRACVVADVTAPVRASATAKALEDLHRDAWNEAIDEVLALLEGAGAVLEPGTLDLIRNLKAVPRG